jgi:hypothetical protein
MKKNTYFNQLSDYGVGRGHGDTGLLQAQLGNLLDERCRAPAGVENTLFVSVFSRHTEILRSYNQPQRWTEEIF